MWRRFFRLYDIQARASNSINVAALAGIYKLKSTVEWIRMALIPMMVENGMPHIKGSLRLYCASSVITGNQLTTNPQEKKWCSIPLLE